MAGHRCVDVFLAVQANGCRRLKYMVVERGLAGRILAVIAVLVARALSPMEGEGCVEIVPTTSLALPWPMGEGLSPMAFEVVG